MPRCTSPTAPAGPCHRHWPAGLSPGQLSPAGAGIGGVPRRRRHGPRRPTATPRQGAGRGYTGIKGLNALIATVSTPSAAPVIAATRLRRGAAYSGHGATGLVADAIATARRCRRHRPPGPGPRRLGVLKQHGDRRRDPQGQPRPVLPSRSRRTPAVRRTRSRAIPREAWIHHIGHRSAIPDPDRGAGSATRRSPRAVHRVQLQAARPTR